MRCFNGNPDEVQPLLNGNARNNNWRNLIIVKPKFAFYFVGIIIFGVLIAVVTAQIESRKDTITTESPFTTLSTVTPGTTLQPTTTTRIPTSTTPNSVELHFEMSEWRDGHCEGSGQCPCHWIETRYCQAINSGS